MTSSKAWLEVALNGPFTRRLQPRIPVTVEEIVADGIACAEAGAAIVHVHSYDAETGRQNDDPDLYAEIIGRIGEATGAIVYPTLALGGDSDARYAPVEALGEKGLMEWGVVDPGSANLTLHSQIERDQSGLLYANADDHIRRGLALAVRYGFHPGYAIYEPGFARSGAAWAARYPGLPQPIYRLMFTDDFTFGFPPKRYALEAYRQLLAEVAPGAPWMIAGLGVDVMPIAADALAMGAGLRVGLEDAPLGCDRGNLDLVTGAVAAMRDAGFEPASPDEVRSRFQG